MKKLKLYRFFLTILSLTLILGLTTSCSSSKTSSEEKISVKNDKSSRNIPTTEGEKEEPVTRKNDDRKYEAAIKQEDQTLEMLKNSINQDEFYAGAVVYLGYVGPSDKNSLTKWLKDNCADYLDQMPFILDIPRDRIIGLGHGDLFCIIPKDDNTSISVNHITWNYEGDEITSIIDDVLYRSDNAEPLLVFVEYDAWTSNPDTFIVIVANDGNMAQWYPTINDHADPILPYDSMENPLLMDLTIQYEYVYDDYDEYCFGDSCWLPPTTLGLANSKWTWDKWLLELYFDDSDTNYRSSAYLYFREDETQDYILDYYGYWGMKDNCLELELYDYNGDHIKGCFPVIVDPSGENLLIEQDRVNRVKLPFFVNDEVSLNLTYLYD